MLINNEWLETGEPIQIDENGFLVNGNHRLHAINETGISVKTYVFFGIKKEACAYIDIGRPRVAKDLIGIHEASLGKEITPSLSRHLSGAIIFLNYLNKKGRVDANTTLEIWIEKREELLKASEILLCPQIKEKDTIGKVLPVSRKIALCYLFLQKDISLTHDFWWNFLIPNSENKIIELCKQRLGHLIAQRQKNTMGHIPKEYYLQFAKVIIHTWNLLRSGSRITTSASFLRNREQSEKWEII